MKVRTGDSIARIGSVVGTLHLAATERDATMTVHSVSGFEVGGRYVIGTEVVRVIAISSVADRLTVERGVDSPAADHAADAALIEVDALYAVVQCSEHTLLPALRTGTRFLHLPQGLRVELQQALQQAHAGSFLNGSYQDEGGDRVVIERAGMEIQSRLGLIIASRQGGGHWEIGVEER